MQRKVNVVNVLLVKLQVTSIYKNEVWSNLSGKKVKPINCKLARYNNRVHSSSDQHWLFASDSKLMGGS